MKIKSKIAHCWMHRMYRTEYLKCNYEDSILEQLVNKNENVELDLVTIAFENPYVVSLQIKLLKKYLCDNYSYIVADNSLTKKKSEMIRKICEDNAVDYVKLPLNPYNGEEAMGSYSNGAAMNYVYRHYIRKRKAQYFGFLDHDIFPIRSCSILERIGGQAFWGTIRCVPTKNSYCCMYPWAGFCFFDKTSLEQDAFDFLPLKGYGDTGASNYKKLYLPIIKSDIFLEYTFANLKRVQIDGIIGSPQSSQYEIIDSSWIHYLNASNWSKEDINEKEKRMKEIIEYYIN